MKQVFNIAKLQCFAAMAMNVQCPLCWSSGTPPFEHVTRPTGGLPNTKAKVIQEILETPGCSFQKADLERQLYKELRHVLQQVRNYIPHARNPTLRRGCLGKLHLLG